MGQTHVSIGQVKRDISELVNRVAYGSETIVLTSRGKPKAALISIADYEEMMAWRQKNSDEQWLAWLGRSDALNEAILRERSGEMVDVDLVWNAVKDDQELRDAQISGG